MRLRLDRGGTEAEMNGTEEGNDEEEGKDSTQALPQTRKQERKRQAVLNVMVSMGFSYL